MRRWRRRAGRPVPAGRLVIHRAAEHVFVQAADHFGQPLLAAKDAHRLRQAAELREGMEGELVERELGVGPDVVVGIRAELVADHAQPGLLTRTEVYRVQGDRVLSHQVVVESGSPRGRVLAITAARIVIATGALERLPVFPGNRSPGIVGSLAAFQRAERFGVWPGKRVLINTPHSAGYRLALYAKDAGVEVQRIIDTRINPHSRYIDFCKATGVTLASGLIATEALTLKRNLPGLRVAFAVAIDEITQDAEPIETDQLIAAGGWQPDIALWLAAGGGATWDATNRWLGPRGTLEQIALAGSAAGYRSATACIASGKAVVQQFFGKPAPPVEDKAIDTIFESPDAPTPIAPFRIATRGTAYLDRGWTLITRRAAAASRHGVSQLAVHPVALSLSDIAAAVAIGAVEARDAASIAAERCTTGGDIADTGWRVTRATLDAGPIPLPPLYLTGRFGPKPQLCVIAVSDSRFFEPGCLVFANSDTTDPLKAIGVIYAAAPGGRSGGLALLEKAPTALDTTLFVRDTSGAVAVKVMERLRA